LTDCAFCRFAAGEESDRNRDADVVLRTKSVAAPAGRAFFAQRLREALGK
jgi:hypothetical protein